MNIKIVSLGGGRLTKYYNILITSVLSYTTTTATEGAQSLGSGATSAHRNFPMLMFLIFLQYSQLQVCISHLE